ncbi:hypothetical protein Gotur_032490 [Gossypium turneri]
MGPYSPGLLNLLIGESYVTILWVRFHILFTEVGSIWVGYERHSWCWGMIKLKYKEYDMLERTSFKSLEVI